jgi:hypothetical protein
MTDWQEGFNKARQGALPPAYVDPSMAVYQAGQAQNRRDEVPLPPRQRWKISEYFGALIGTPIVVAVIVGGVALLQGGDYVRWGLTSGGGVFAVILVLGLLSLAVRAFVIVAPLLFLGAAALYLLGRIGVGPGLP